MEWIYGMDLRSKTEEVRFITVAYLAFCLITNLNGLAVVSQREYYWNQVLRQIQKSKSGR